MGASTLYLETPVLTLDNFLEDLTLTLPENPAHLVTCLLSDVWLLARKLRESKKLACHVYCRVCATGTELGP